MSGKIPVYQRVEFENHELAQAASDALMNYVTASRAMVMSMTGPDRVVMWHDSVDIYSRVLLLSPGAHRILSGLVTLPAATPLLNADLPAKRQLMLGDARFETFD